MAVNAILPRRLRGISSGRAAMLHLGPIRDFLGLIVGHGPAPVSNLRRPITPRPWPLETTRELARRADTRPLHAQRNVLVLRGMSDRHLARFSFRGGGDTQHANL